MNMTTQPKNTHTHPISKCVLVFGCSLYLYFTYEEKLWTVEWVIYETAGSTNHHYNRWATRKKKRAEFCKFNKSSCSSKWQIYIFQPSSCNRLLFCRSTTIFRSRSLHSHLFFPFISLALHQVYKYIYTKFQSAMKNALFASSIFFRNFPSPHCNIWIIYIYG